MFVPFELGVKSESFVTVPLLSFVYPLCVIKDYGGEKNRYLVVLPKRQWGRYFGSDRQIMPTICYLNWLWCKLERYICSSESGLLLSFIPTTLLLR